MAVVGTEGTGFGKLEEMEDDEEELTAVAAAAA
jgi:hypothetical protein